MRDLPVEFRVSFRPVETRSLIDPVEFSADFALDLGEFNLVRLVARRSLTFMASTPIRSAILSRDSSMSSYRVVPLIILDSTGRQSTAMMKMTSKTVATAMTK